MNEFRTRRGGESGEVYTVGQNPFSGLAMGAGTLVIIVLVLIALFFSVTVVSTGHVAVLTRFGRVTGTVLGEGMHFKNPLDRANEMLVRTQELKETASVPSNEGLIMTLDASLIFKMRPESAPEVFRTLGRTYVETIVEPNLRSAIRSATAAHTANALYTGAREEVAKQIRTELAAQLTPRGIEVENVLLRDVQLPPTLKASIEAKQRSEQEALQMNFVLQKEKQEAERKQAYRDPDPVAFDQVGLEGRMVAAGHRLLVEGDRSRNVAAAPSSQLPTQPEVEVFEVGEEGLVEEAHLLQHRTAVERGAAVGAQHFVGAVVLADVLLEPAPRAADAVRIDEKAGGIEDLAVVEHADVGREHAEAGLELVLGDVLVVHQVGFAMPKPGPMHIVTLS